MKFPIYGRTIVIIVLLLFISVMFFNLQNFESRSPRITLKEVLNIRQTSSQHQGERERLLNELELSSADKTKFKQLSQNIGVGVEKCGTHALIQLLMPHSLILVPQNLETHFFDNPKAAADIIKDYLDFLPVAEEHDFVMEKTPAYFNFHSFDIPYVIKNMVPGAKLFLTLCYPVHRAFNDFVHEKIIRNITDQQTETDNFKSNEEYLDIYIPRVKSYIGEYHEAESFAQAKKTFELTKKDFLSHILKTGFYALHLRRWLEGFKDNELLIIDAEELMLVPGTVVEKIQDFVILPKVLLREDFVKDIETGFYSYKD